MWKEVFENFIWAHCHYCDFNFNCDHDLISKYEGLSMRFNFSPCISNLCGLSYFCILQIMTERLLTEMMSETLPSNELLRTGESWKIDKIYMVFEIKINVFNYSYWNFKSLPWKLKHFKHRRIWLNFLFLTKILKLIL